MGWNSWDCYSTTVTEQEVFANATFMHDHLDHLRDSATMWRVCNDLWDRWDHVEAQFARMARWAPWQTERGWADADMLPRAASASGHRHPT